MMRPHFRSQAVAITVGLVLLVLTGFVLYDAWEGRGKRAPWPMRVVSWW